MPSVAAMNTVLTRWRHGRVGAGELRGEVQGPREHLVVQQLGLSVERERVHSDVAIFECLPHVRLRTGVWTVQRDLCGRGWGGDWRDRAGALVEAPGRGILLVPTATSGHALRRRYPRPTTVGLAATGWHGGAGRCVGDRAAARRRWWRRGVWGGRPRVCTTCGVEAGWDGMRAFGAVVAAALRLALGRGDAWVPAVAAAFWRHRTAGGHVAMWRQG